MIEKMKFLSITGPKDDIDRIIDTCQSMIFNLKMPLQKSKAPMDFILTQRKTLIKRSLIMHKC